MLLGLTFGFTGNLTRLTLITLVISLYHLFDLLMLLQGKIAKNHMIDENSYMYCIFAFHFDMLRLLFHVLEAGGDGSG